MKSSLRLDGTDRAFPITGKIRHPFVPPPDFGGNAYFFTDAEAMARFGIPQGQFLQVLVRVEPYSEEYARDRAAAIKEQLAKQGIGIGLTIYQEPEEHWGRPFVTGITAGPANSGCGLALDQRHHRHQYHDGHHHPANRSDWRDQGDWRHGGTIIARFIWRGCSLYGLLALLIALPLGMLAAFAGAR